MRLWKILLALLLALTGSSPSALASIPLAQENLCTGHFRGVVSGLRYYNPAQGRWVGRDSAGEEGGANLFGFCYNNAITGCDPFGKMVEDPLEAGAIGAGMEGTSGAMMNAIVGQAEAVADETFIAEATELDEGLAMQSKSFSVYQSVGADGQVNYVGMTSRFEERAAEQLLERQITIGKIPGLNNLSSADARAVEQTLIDSFKLGKNGGSLINKINSISSTSDPEYYINSILRGMDLLSKAGYGGF